MKKGSFQIPTNISPDFQDLLKNIITWDSNKRYKMSQILNHTFSQGTNLVSAFHQTQQTTTTYF